MKRWGYGSFDVVINPSFCSDKNEVPHTFNVIDERMHARRNLKVKYVANIRTVNCIVCVYSIERSWKKDWKMVIYLLFTFSHLEHRGDWDDGLIFLRTYWLTDWQTTHSISELEFFVYDTHIIFVCKLLHASPIRSFSCTRSKPLIIQSKRLASFIHYVALFHMWVMIGCLLISNDMTSILHEKKVNKVQLLLLLRWAHDFTNSLLCTMFFIYRLTQFASKFGFRARSLTQL